MHVPPANLEPTASSSEERIHGRVSWQTCETVIHHEVVVLGDNRNRPRRRFSTISQSVAIERGIFSDGERNNLSHRLHNAPPSANASPTIDLSAQSQQLISAIAASTNAEVMGTETFNPYEEHKQGGPHSRVEYRLDAYKESAGVHGTINGVSVDTVVYRNGKMQRVYLFGNENDVMALYPQVAKVLDPSLSDADITAAVTKYQTDEAKTQTDLLSLSDSHRLMQSDSIIGSGNDCEAFMDANTGN